jgi:hypothetical protein
MAEKVTKSMKVSASGLLNIEDNDIFIEVEDVGTFSLKKLLKNFDGCGVKLSCSYDEEQSAPEEEQKIDKETGELID